jgi:hypothetical protein
MGTTNGTVFKQEFNGVVYDSNNYVFKDGKLCLTAKGAPKRRPGRKPKVTTKPAGAPEDTGAPDAAPDGQTAVVVVEAENTVSVVSESVVSVATGAVAVATESAGVASAPAETAQKTEPQKTEPEQTKAPEIPLQTIPTVAPVAPQEQVSQVGFMREIHATVSRSFGKVGATSAENETLSVRTFLTAPATVDVGYGLTINLGNFESARVDVRVSVPCYREETDAAYEWAKGWVGKRLEEEVRGIRGNGTSTLP